MITDKIKTRGKDLSVLEGMDRIQYLVDLAKEVKPLADKHKINQNKSISSLLMLIYGEDFYHKFIRNFV